MSKQPNVHFDLKRQSQLIASLPSGARKKFYRGRPEINVVSDPRDVAMIRERPDAFEVMTLVKTKAGEQWMPIEVAKDYKSKKRQTATTKGQEQADESGAANPAAPVTTAVVDDEKKSDTETVPAGDDADKKSAETKQQEPAKAEDKKPETLGAKVAAKVTGKNKGKKK